MTSDMAATAAPANDRARAQPRLTFGLVLAGVAVVVAGCATIGPTDPQTVSSCAGHRFPRPHDNLDACDPAAVLLATAETVFTHMPLLDTGPEAGFVKARALLDPDYGRRAAASAGVLDPLAVADWASWRGAGVAVAATARIAGDDHPADTTTRFARVVTVTQQPSDRSPPRELAVYITATRTSPAAPWLVDRINAS